MTVALAVPHGVLAAPSPADRALAQQLFEDARRILRGSPNQAELEQACRKLEDSQRLDPAPGTFLNMALCHEREGRYATAWSELKQAVSQARQAGRTVRLKIARKHLDQVEGRLSYLRINVPEEARVPGLMVTRNGNEVPQAAWGSMVPTDPGVIRVEAAADGYESWSSKIELEPQQRLKLTVPALEEAPEARTGKDSSRDSSQPGLESAAAGARPERGWSTTQLAGFVVGGAGLVTLGIGGYFGVRALTLKSESEDGCGEQGGRLVCTDRDSFDANEEAVDSGTLANVLGGVGLGVFVTGVALVLFGGHGQEQSPATARSWHWSASADPEHAYLQLSGRF